MIQRGFVLTSFGHIHYRAAGAGPPIIMLHINQQSSAFYVELLQAVSGFARGIAIDYPSHGCSDHIPPPTIADYARCVREVMDGLGLAEATILGEATGAGITAELAGTHPERVTRAVLVNCPKSDILAPRAETVAEFVDYRPEDASGFPLTRTIDFMLAKDPDHSPLHPTQEWMDRINRAQMEAGRDRWQALGALSQFSMTGALARVKCPTLFLTGDHFYHRKHLPDLTRHVADHRVHILPEARFCAGWEKAAEIAVEVRRFMSR